MDNRKLIEPMQMWLLMQGRCVACGRELQYQRRQGANGKTLVTCRCNRVFVKEDSLVGYRRATLEDIA